MNWTLEKIESVSDDLICYKCERTVNFTEKNEIEREKMEDNIE